MSQVLEDFATDQRVRGDTDLAREVFEALDVAAERDDWCDALRVESQADANRRLDEREALLAECEHCESLNFDDSKPLESLRAGLKRLEKTSDEMIDLRELLVSGGYLARDDRTTPLVSLVAQFMPPLTP